MAHWAEIDESSRVLRVVVTSNDLPDEGKSWLVSTLGGTWVQTSYNGNFRGKFAGVRDLYDADIDEFVTAPEVPDATV
jgi:hypothetical protein